MCADGAHHVGQRLGGGPVAVQHQERFTVVRTDANLQAHLIGVGVGDHTADLEPVDFAHQHAVLHHGQRPACGDRGCERLVLGRQRRCHR